MATTLAQLISRTRSRGDFGAASSSSEDDFVTNEEITDWLNQSRAKLYHELIKCGLIVRRATTDITATGAADYALGDNSTVFSILSVAFVAGPNDLWPLRRHSSRVHPTSLPGAGGWGGTDSYHVFESDDSGSLRIEFGESLPTSGTFRVWYVPEQAALVLSGDQVNFPNGWDEILVLDACIKGKLKGEEDVTDLVRERDGLWGQVRAEAEAREANETQVIENADSPYRGYAWRTQRSFW